MCQAALEAAGAHLPRMATARILSLPFHPALTHSDVRQVAALLRQALQGRRLP